MIVAHSQVSPALRSMSGRLPQQLAGIGRIVMTENEVILQSSGEIIILDPKVRNNLSNGMVVHYHIEDDQIVISPAVLSTPQSTISNDSIIISQERTATPPAPPLLLPDSVKDGFYRFTQLTEALRLFGIDEQSDIAAIIKDIIDKNGIVIMKIDRTLPQQHVLSILTPSDFEQSMATLQGLLKSDILRKFSLESFTSTVLSIGSVTTEFINGLDNALLNLDMPIPTQRSGSIAVQTQMLDHWFRITAAASLPPDVCMKMLPVVDSQQLLESVVSPDNYINPSMLKDTPHIPLNETAISSKSPKFLVRAFEQMGYSLEHDLALQETEAPSNSIAPSLKASLLSLQTVTKRIPEPIPTTLYNNTITQPDSNQLSRFSPEMFRNREIISLCNNLRDIIISLKTMHPLDIEQAFPGYQKPGTATAPEQTPNVTTLDYGINKTEELLSFFNKPSFESTSRPIPQPLNSLISQLSGLVHALTSIQQADATPVPPQPETSGALPPTPAQSQKLLSDALTIIEALQNNYLPDSTAPAQQIPDAEQQRQTLSRQKSQADVLISDFFSSLQPSLTPSTLAKAIEAMESLQLLAKQVATNEGTEQVIALPIRFDDQITEITIRLLNRQKKQQKKRDVPHYSIFIDVAPPSLGSIHSHLDYYQSKQLQIHLHCKSKKAVCWFENHTQTILQNLQPVFKIPVTMDVTLQRPKKESLHHETTPITIIDMKV